MQTPNGFMPRSHRPPAGASPITHQASARAGEHRCGPTIWLDVGDLLWWPHDHLTGIQRVQLSVLLEIFSRPPHGLRVRFCKYADGRGFVETTDRQVADCIARFAGGDMRQPQSLAQRKRFFVAGFASSIGQRVGGVIAGVRRGLRSVLLKLPGPVVAHLRGLRHAAAGWISALVRPLRKLDPRRFAPSIFSSDDVVLNIGSSWRDRSYAPALTALKARIGFQFVLMIYDMIPWRMPHVFDRDSRSLFSDWVATTLILADRVLAISRCTRGDVLAFMQSTGIPAKPVSVVRLGQARASLKSPAAGAPWSFAQDPAGFVLCVGTIEIRKNHDLLLRVWATLLERHDRSQIPYLVWVGHKGWLVESLFAELDRRRALDGRIIHLGEPVRRSLRDAELETLYRSCKFTVFPSVYEGWGLPVAESLAHGKVCIASNAASIPEIAGNLVDYHAPDDFDECLRLTEQAIFDVAYRQGREREIRERFDPPSWADCAKAVLAACLDAAATKDATVLPGIIAVSGSPRDVSQMSI